MAMNHEGQAIVQAMLGDYSLYPQFEGAAYDPQLGFLTLPSDQDHEVTVVGLGSPMFPGQELPDQAEAWTWDDLPEELQTISEQGKGPGPRLYNTEAGAHSSRRRMPIAPYAVTLDRGRILEKRRPTDATRIGQLGRIVTHGKLIVEGRRTSPEHVVRGIESRYDTVFDGAGAQAVLWNEPPNSVRRRAQDLRHRPWLPKIEVPTAEGSGTQNLRSEFLIVRQAIMLRRVGEQTIF